MTGCVVGGFDHGIYLYGSSNSTVEESSSSGNSLYGIRVHSPGADKPAADNVIINCQVSGNGKGIYLTGSVTSNNEITGNLVCGNGSVDIGAEGSAMAVGLENTCDATNANFHDEGVEGCTVSCP